MDLGIDLSADNLLRLFGWLAALIASLSVHEAAHAWMAYRRGDGTAYYQGRLTLDPLAHIDPLGTIVLPIIMFFTSVALFGWARPVPVNIYNLTNPLRDWMLVALAGPISNIIQGVFWLVILKIYVVLFPDLLPNVFGGGPLVEEGMGIAHALLAVLGFFIYISILLNFILAVFNMIPIPPLDGSRVLNYILPHEGQDLLFRLEPYGFLILLALLWAGVIQAILLPTVNVVIGLMEWVIFL